MVKISTILHFLIELLDILADYNITSSLKRRISYCVDIVLTLSAKHTPKKKALFPFDGSFVINKAVEGFAIYRACSVTKVKVEVSGL